MLFPFLNSLAFVVMFCKIVREIIMKSLINGIVHITEKELFNIRGR